MSVLDLFKKKPKEPKPPKVYPKIDVGQTIATLRGRRNQVLASAKFIGEMSPLSVDGFRGSEEIARKWYHFKMYHQGYVGFKNSHEKYYDKDVARVTYQTTAYYIDDTR